MYMHISPKARLSTVYSPNHYNIPWSAVCPQYMYIFFLICDFDLYAPVKDPITFTIYYIENRVSHKMWEKEDENVIRDRSY